jgi:hypothetical protein
MTVNNNYVLCISKRRLKKLEWLSSRKQTAANAGRMQEKGTVIHCLWECKLVLPIGKAIWRFLKKLKIELP